MPKLDCEPIRDEDRWPVCPHCEKEIKKMRYFENPGLVRSRVVRTYVCPHCLKVLGIGTS
jgi:uncharacterized protein with PIN domain